MALLENLMAGQIQLTGQGGGMSSTCLLLGAGSSTNKATTNRASVNFMDFRCETTNTSASSDSRALYLRLYVNGTGHGTADAARIFTTVQKAVANAHGAHTSLSYSSTGSTTGQAIAGRNTFHIPNSTLSGGTCAALQAEVYLDGTSSDPGTTKLGLLRLCVAGGDATAANKIKNAILIDSNQTDGTGQMIYSHSHTQGDAKGSIRILVNGAVRYLKFWDAE